MLLLCDRSFVNRHMGIIFPEQLVSTMLLKELVFFEKNLFPFFFLLLLLFIARITLKIIIKMVYDWSIFYLTSFLFLGNILIYPFKIFYILFLVIFFKLILFFLNKATDVFKFEVYFIKSKIIKK